LSSHSIQEINDNNFNINLDITGKNYNLVYYLLNQKNKIIYKSKPQKELSILLNKDEIEGKRLKLFVRTRERTVSYITPIIRNIYAIEFNKST